MKITFKASGTVAEKLKESSEMRGLSNVDIVRRALELYFICETAQCINPDIRIAIVEGDRIIEKYILL